MNRKLLAAAVALPLAGLTASIAVHETALAGASEWRIPIVGYDPRDLIRGRYIRFAYAWSVAGDAAACIGGVCDLCLAQDDGIIVASVRAPGAVCAHRLDLAASNIAVLASAPGGAEPQFSGRIFVSESSAPRIERMLRERPMVVRARLTNSGRLVHDRLEPADQANGD